MTRLFILLGRFVGLAIAGLGIWIFGSNAMGDGPAQVPTVVLTLAAVGAVGGILYLASLEDHGPLRSRWMRIVGWAGMLALAVLPWSFWMYTLPFVLLVLPTIFMDMAKGREQAGNSDRSVNAAEAPPGGS